MKLASYLFAVSGVLTVVFAGSPGFASDEIPCTVCDKARSNCETSCKDGPDPHKCIGWCKIEVCQIPRCVRKCPTYREQCRGLVRPTVEPTPTSSANNTKGISPTSTPEVDVCKVCVEGLTNCVVRCKEGPHPRDCDKVCKTRTCRIAPCFDCPEFHKECLGMGEPPTTPTKWPYDVQPTLIARDDVCIKLENEWIVCRRGCTIKECHTKCLTDMCYDKATLSGQCTYGVTCQGVPDPRSICFDKWTIYNTCHKNCTRKKDCNLDCFNECKQSCYEVLCSNVPKDHNDLCDQIHKLAVCAKPTRRFAR